MATLFRVRQGLYVACTLTSLLFAFASFLIHSDRKRRRRSLVLRKTHLRFFVIVLISTSYPVETILVATRGDELANLRDDLAMTVIQTAVWLSIGLRKSLLLLEVLGIAAISSIFSIPILVLSTLSHHQSQDPTPCQYLQSAVQWVRLAIQLSLVVDTSYRGFYRRETATEDSKPLLGSSNGSVDDHTEYGTESLADPSADDSDDDSDSDTHGSRGKDSPYKKIRKSGSWILYLQNFRVFLPFLIPRKDIKVQLCLAVCLVCLMAERALNVLVPRQLGIVTDKLSSKQAPFAELGVWFLLSVIQDESGIGLVQTLAKIPIRQFSSRQITNAAFTHVMSLSMEFHSERDSAEVMKAVEQGRSLNDILEAAVLDIAPTIIDMFIAFFLLYAKFNASVAMCMVVAAIVFLSLQVISSKWNIKNRRRITETERDQTRIMHQAVQGWRTVSAFNMFAYEKDRFRKAVDNRLAASMAYNVRDALIKGPLELVIPVTFFALGCLVVYEVSQGRASTGDFVFLITYWGNMIWPLKFLMHEYRWLVRSLIDAERLLDLLTTKPSVSDKEGARNIGQVRGQVEFQHVGFSYDARRTAIVDVNLSAAPGETIALVGATGAGKSTLTKLLLRYYDISSGSIMIDGQDIRDVTLGSLRDVLGVVPQDPLLFNASIMENLRYARLTASEDEIMDACRASAIHDKILTFPDGYNTVVGEQGVKLSGGEIQRLAIARVFLKDPPILILDEATSAVDTQTESEIQSALRRLSRKRTTFIVAHRLSTVVGADQILVVEDGSIAEKGTHRELLAKKGRYHNLWSKQIAHSE